MKLTKRMLCLALALALTFALCACGDKDGKDTTAPQNGGESGSTTTANNAGGTNGTTVPTFVVDDDTPMNDGQLSWD